MVPPMIRLPDDFWAVNEDEPGLWGFIAAFAVFAMFLLVVFLYIVALVP